MTLAEEIERRGGNTVEYIRGNACADLLAKSAMHWHEIDYVEYDQADDREFLAAVVQAMLETIWAKAFDQDVNLRGLEDHSAEAPPDEHETDGDREDRDDALNADELDRAPRDPLSLPNQQLAAFVKRVAPSFQWDQPWETDLLEEITFPDLPHYARLQRRTSALIEGRGMVNLSFAFPTHYADAVRWWLNNLKWVTQSSLIGLPMTATSVTHLECVIDFEMSTGLRLGLDGACATTWSAKARALYYIIKALARIYTINIGCNKVGFKHAFLPRSNVASLAPLGAPVMAGFARRPVWVCRRTPQVVAANVWRARAAHRRVLAAAAPSTSLSARSRTFAHEWDVNYEGFPSDDRWLPKASASLTTAIATAKHGRPHEVPPEDREQHPTPRRSTNDPVIAAQPLRQPSQRTHRQANLSPRPPPPPARHLHRPPLRGQTIWPPAAPTLIYLSPR